MTQKKKNKHRRLFWLSLCFMALFSFCFLGMPFASELRLRGEAWGLKAIGACFWLTAFLAAGTILWADRLARQLSRKNDPDAWRGRPGLFCFFQNSAAKAVDLLLAGSVIGLAALLITRCSSRLLFSFISVVLLLLLSHSMLNGKNYRFLRAGKLEK